MKKSVILCIIISFLFYYNALAAATAFTYQIDGLSGDALDNANSQLSAMIAHLGEQPSNAELDQLYQHAAESIKQAIQPFGYFKAHVHSHLKKRKKLWHARFKVTPGPVLRIKAINIAITGPGANETAFTAFKQQFPLKPGDPLDVALYKKAKKDLFTLAQHYGYLAGTLLKQQLSIDLIRYQAIITLHFDTGKRFYFGKTQFSQTAFDTAFLTKFLPYSSGEPFSSDAISAAQTNLNDSNYFTSVAVTPHQQTGQQQIPIDIHLVPKPSQAYHAGGGYGTDTGVRGILGWDWNNITSTGQHFSAELQASLVQSHLQGTYYIPGHDPLKQQYSLGAGLQTENINGKSTTANVTGAYMFNTKNWQRTISASYQFEKFKPEDEQQQRSHLFMPTITLSHTYADNSVFAKNGEKINLIVKTSLKPLISSISFIQAQLEGKLIRTVQEDNRFIIRGEYGYTAVNDFDAFPLSQRFFAGGTDSIRGYDYKQFGPGKTLVTASAEYQRRVYGNWYISGFFDAGGVFNQADDNTIADNLNRAIGTGIVYASPIGPLELTVAHPLNRRRNAYAIQFTMGPDL